MCVEQDREIYYSVLKANSYFLLKLFKRDERVSPAVGAFNYTS